MAFEQMIYEQCFFDCQQAEEKSLKALLIERSPSGRARRTHDLPSLAEELSLDLSGEQFHFLRRSTELYIPTRYGDEEVNFEELQPEAWLRQTEEFLSWLRRLLI